MNLQRTLFSHLQLLRPLTFAVCKPSQHIRRIHATRRILSKSSNSKDDDDAKNSADRDAALYKIIQETSMGAFGLSAMNHPRGGDDEGGGDWEATNLLITLDALGTLYEVKNGDVGEEYARVAERGGWEGLKGEEVNARFREAFKELTASHPNYGYASGMTPKEWWEQIAVKTFTPFLPASTPSLPPTLASSLWTHFSTASAYSLFPGTIPFLRNMQDLKSLAERTRTGSADWKFRTVTIGVISNSDDRIIDVLNSMDIKTSHQVVSQEGELGKVLDEPAGDNPAVDFAITSCRLGVAKPQREIFETARKAAEMLISRRCGDEEVQRGWEWYHVGDDPKEDVTGAYEAGAVGILFDQKKEIGETEVIVGEENAREGYNTMVVGDLREIAEFAEGLGILYQAGSRKVKWKEGTTRYVAHAPLKRNRH